MSFLKAENKDKFLTQVEIAALESHVVFIICV